MGAGHGHSTGADAGPVTVGARARLVLVITLGIFAAATLFGLVRFWPDSDTVRAAVTATDFAAPGVTFPQGPITSLTPACPTEDGAVEPATPESDCGTITVALESDVDVAEPVPGGEVTVPVPPAVTDSGLRVGDVVQLMRVPAGDGVDASYSFIQVQRGTPLLILLIIFVAVVALIARWRGILALVGLGFGGFVVAAFMLPALLEGRSGVVVALVGSSAIMFVVLYLAHGLSIRTSTALAGTLFGVAITAVLGMAAVGAARLSGVGDDEGATLASFVPTMHPRELLACAIIVAGLGVLNDVTITQSSAVWELRAVAPGLSRMDLFKRGMRIGRDHIASTIYTIVFAYAGAALPVLMLVLIYERPLLDLLQSEPMGEEIVRTLASAIGLVLAVPATTAIAAMTVAGPEDRSAHGQAAE